MAMIPVNPTSLWHPVLAGNDSESDDDFAMSEVSCFTCQGISSSHWANPQGDALQGIIPHSVHLAEVWSQGLGWSGCSRWPSGGSQGHGSCSTICWIFGRKGRPPRRMMFPSCWQIFSFGLGHCRVNGQNKNSVFEDSSGLWVSSSAFLSFKLLLARL